MEPLTITLRTLTPLWTGGVDGQCDRLHETGLIGSLRWWYEALVRGLGGQACDPTSEEPKDRCQFDSKAYERVKQEGKSQTEALQAGLATICPVCYLFGATGWARLFRLQATSAPTTPLHFRTSVNMNKGWLKRVFGGEAQNIDNLTVPYGDIDLRAVLRGYDEDYVKSQLALLFRFVATYGGLGARLQHGFGLVEVNLPEVMEKIAFTEGVKQLGRVLREGNLRDGLSTTSVFDLSNFVSMEWEIPPKVLQLFTNEKSHIGNLTKKQESDYLPCAFDLRYKGSGNFGIRQWLKRNEQWPADKINRLMGVSEKKGQKIQDDDRQASYLSFGMPYQQGDSYRLRVFGFAPLDVLSPDDLRELCQRYVQHVFEVQPASVVLGRDLTSSIQGVAQ